MSKYKLAIVRREVFFTEYVMKFYKLARKKVNNPIKMDKGLEHFRRNTNG